MNIPIFKRRRFGNIDIHIADEEIAAQVRTLTRPRTCIDEFDMAALEKLGHTFDLVPDPSL